MAGWEAGRALAPPLTPSPLFSSSLQGRAMKRIKFNRRFVNVAVGFGKKKGPNSQ